MDDSASEEPAWDSWAKLRTYMDENDHTPQSVLRRLQTSDGMRAAAKSKAGRSGSWSLPSSTDGEAEESVSEGEEESDPCAYEKETPEKDDEIVKGNALYNALIYRRRLLEAELRKCVKRDKDDDVTKDLRAQTLSWVLLRA